MTAEVAILNKSAVALAADSKVSIGFRYPEKTYDSQNKIFTLSKVHPVGIMVYNNADFMNYPWETIIKQYRSEKAGKVEPTMELWARDFISFLRKFGEIKKEQITDNIYDILCACFDSIGDLAFDYAQHNNVSVPSKKFEEILSSFIEKRIGLLSTRNRLLTARQSNHVLSVYGDDILRAVSHFVPNASNKNLIDASIEFAGQALIVEFFSPISSGLVFAGFGGDEVFPSTVHYETDGYIGSAIKLSKPNTSKITRKNTSSVLAFAQHEIVERFMEGIDPEYSAFLRGAFKTTLVESNLKTFQKWMPKDGQTERRKNSVRKAAMKQYQDILDKSINYRRARFWSPTMDMVSLLPKDELAHLAESLVELTSLHRRVSREIETVGGPIDVAIISKGDGFIWYKRKHYFDLKLNRHFELNYMRDV